MLISSKCELCHCFEAHWHTDNLKNNILILTPTKIYFDFMAPLSVWVTAFSPRDSDSVSQAMSVTAVIIITVFVHHSTVLSAL